jgi:AAA+ ATPase superfamily predicted ATPase
MYFDPSPKEKEKDFYNYKLELESIEKGIMKNEKLIFIKGVRRVGKTSLMKVIFNKIQKNLPCAYIDARKIQSRLEFLNAFYVAASAILKEIIPHKRFLDLIKGFSIETFGFRVGIRLEETTSNIFETLDNELAKNGKRAVIFIDEVQKTKRFGGDAYLSYLYDSTKMITFVMSGSEVGILEEFSGASTDSPLSGRAKLEVELKRLGREKSMEFLEIGFKEIEKKIDKEEIEEIVNEFDGVIGWLTLYGYYRRRFSKEKAKEIVLEEGKKIVMDEIENFLKNKKMARNRYITIMRLLKEEKGWKDIKLDLKKKIGVSVSDSRLATYIDNLLRYSFIEKINSKYILADPILRRVI